jgi:hypothetical protein
MVRTGVAVGKLNVVDLLAALLDAEPEVLAVYQELREVIELGGQLPHV